MGYFSALEKSAFRVKDGVTSFFPYGIIADGFIVPSQDEQKLRLFIRAYYIVMFPALIGSQFVFGFIGIAAVVVVQVVVYAVVVRIWTRQWQPITERLTLRESQETMGKEMGLMTTIVLLGSSVMMMLAAASVAIRGSDPWLGVGGASFFGICTWLFVGVLMRRKRQKTA